MYCEEAEKDGVKKYWSGNFIGKKIKDTWITQALINRLNTTCYDQQTKEYLFIRTAHPTGE